MPDKMLVIRGNFEEVNRHLNMGEPIAIPTSVREQAINDDINRSAFINSHDKTLRDYELEWEATPDSTPFCQGIIDASFYQPILDDHLLSQIASNPAAYVRDNHPTLSFAYFDDDDIPCAVSIHYSTLAPKQWTAAIIRNTTAAPQNREVLFMSSSALSSENGSRTTLPQAQTAFSSFLKSKKANGLLSGFIKPNREVNLTKLNVLSNMIQPNLNQEQQLKLTEKAEEEEENRIAIFVNYFKQQLMNTLNDPDEMLNAIRSRGNLSKNGKMITDKLSSQEYASLLKELDEQPRLSGQESIASDSTKVGYTLEFPDRILGEAQRTGLPQTEIDRLSNSQLFILVNAVFHCTSNIVEPLITLINPQEDQTQLQDLIQKVNERCNQASKDVIQAYLHPIKISPPIDEATNKKAEVKQAYLDLLKEIELPPPVDVEEMENSTTVTQESDNENDSPANTAWNKTARQVGLALLAVGVMAAVGFFAAPLILPLVGAALFPLAPFIGTALAGVLAAIVTGVILAPVAVAIGGLFFGINELINRSQTKELNESNELTSPESQPMIESNELTSPESQPMIEINDTPLTNQMAKLGPSVDTPSEKVAYSLANTPPAYSEKENEPENQEQKTLHP